MDGYLNEWLEWGLVLGLKGVPAPYAFELGTWEEGDIVWGRKSSWVAMGLSSEERDCFSSEVLYLRYRSMGTVRVTHGTLTLSYKGSAKTLFPINNPGRFKHKAGTGRSLKLSWTFLRLEGDRLLGEILGCVWQRLKWPLDTTKMAILIKWPFDQLSCVWLHR